MQTPHPFDSLRRHARQMRERLSREASPAPEETLCRYDRIIEQLDAGIHPTCARCGERIEIDRLMQDPCVQNCWSCGRQPR